MNTTLKKSVATSQEKSTTATVKQTVRIEFVLPEMEYIAMHEDEEWGDSFAFNEDEMEDLSIYVDDESLSDEILEEIEDENVKYTTLSDEENLTWDEEEFGEVVSFGHICNEQCFEYEFETELFDYKKLSFVYEVFDIVYEKADFRDKGYRISVFYDGEELENLIDGSSGDGDYDEIWAIDEGDNDFEDEDEIEGEEEKLLFCGDAIDDSVKVDIEAQLRQKYDKVTRGEPVFCIKLDGKYGIADSKGNELVSPRYDWMGDGFNDDIIMVGTDDGVGFLNAEGVEIVTPKYRSATDFENGYAGVCSYDNRKWGFIDTSGKEIIPPIYDDIVSVFSCGKAEVCLNKEYFYIDILGNRIS